MKSRNDGPPTNTPSFWISRNQTFSHNWFQNFGENPFVISFAVIAQNMLCDYRIWNDYEWFGPKKQFVNAPKLRKVSNYYDSPIKFCEIYIIITFSKYVCSPKNREPVSKPSISPAAIGAPSIEGSPP